MCFREGINYNGYIIYEKETFTFSIADTNDVKQIANMYSEISINYSNYKSKLNPESSDSFVNIGGMFIVFDEEGLGKEIQNEHSFWAVIKNENGNIVASFWFADNNDFFNDFKYELKGKNIYPREIIVSEKYKVKDIAKILYYTIFCAMERVGYDISICDVYKVVEYETDLQKHSVELLNNSSFNVMLSLKGIYLGEGKKRKINLDRLIVWIVPQVFIFHYKKTIPYYQEILKQNEINIVWR